MSNRINTESLETYLERYKDYPEHFRNHMAEVYNEVQQKIADDKAQIGFTFDQEFLYRVKNGGHLDNPSLAEYLVDKESTSEMTREERDEKIEAKNAELDIRDAANSIMALVNVVWKQRCNRHADDAGEYFSFPDEGMFSFVFDLAYCGAMVYRVLEKQYEDETVSASKTLKKKLFDLLKEDLEEDDD